MRVLNFEERSIEIDDILVWQSQIEYVPPEIIRLEGFINLKKVKEPGGKEPKKSGWNTLWGIVCVGFLVLYKDEPAKLRKVTSCQKIFTRASRTLLTSCFPPEIRKSIPNSRDQA